jgi:hypothetical protein
MHYVLRTTYHVSGHMTDLFPYFHRTHLILFSGNSLLGQSYKVFN